MANRNAPLRVPHGQKQHGSLVRLFLCLAVVFPVLQFWWFSILSSEQDPSLTDNDFLHSFSFLSFDTEPLSKSNESFSACLLTMEDDAIGLLQEWLAYHYTTLPLRRLIVANDPRSRTSPSWLLERWKNRMEITEWTDRQFFPVTVRNRAMKDDAADTQEGRLVILHRYRQRFFYVKCLRQLKRENKTMVALVDSDEFVNVPPNVHWKHKAKVQHGIDQVMRHGTHITVMEFLKRLRGYPPATLPCISMPRLLFGPYEDGNMTIHRFDRHALDSIHASARDFMTLRWQWHGPLPLATTPNKTPGKAIVDVSRIPYSTLDFTHMGDPHRPVRDCCDERDVWIFPVDSPLIVHHYVGRYDQWSFRNDPRKHGDDGQRRTRRQFEGFLRTLNATKDDSITGWLGDFVQQMDGPEEARWLMEGLLGAARTNIDLLRGR
jgi:hypothetical protein